MKARTALATAERRDRPKVLGPQGRALKVAEHPWERRLRDLMAGGPVTTWFDPSIKDSTEIEVVATCGDRSEHLGLAPLKELELIAIEAEKAGLQPIQPCCARSSRRVYEMLKGAAPFRAVAS